MKVSRADLAEMSTLEHQRVVELAASSDDGCVAARKALRSAAKIGLDAKPYVITGGKCYGWWLGQPCELFALDSLH
jgi:hypothetical protein